MKRLLSVALALAMLISCFAGMSLEAFAAQRYTASNGVVYLYKSIDGGVQITSIQTYNADNLTKLTIPSKINGKSVKVIGKEACEWNDIKELVIPNSVQTIKEGAFHFATRLQKLTIGSSVKTIGKYAFENRRLKTITVNKNNKYFTVKNNVLFNKKKTVLYMYPCAKSGTSYTVPSTVTRIASNAFVDSKLKTIKLPSKLKKIEDSAFGGTQIKSITLPKTVTAVGYGAFRGCSKLTSVDLSKTKVKAINDKTFAYSESLKAVKLPSTVTNIGCEVFSYTAVSTLNLSKSLKEIKDGAFVQSNIKEFKVPSKAKYFSTSKGVLFNKKKTALVAYPAKKSSTSYTVPSGVTSVKSYAFADSKVVKSITLPKTVTKIGYDSFRACSKLTSVDLSKSKVKTIAKAAFELTPLKSVKLPSTLTTINSDAFYKHKLTSIAFPKNLTTIGSYAFYSYSAKLEKIDLSKTKVTGIGEHAFSCTGATSVKFPTTLKKINSSAFSSNKISSVKIPKGVEYVGDGAFAYNNLGNVYINGKETKFGSSPFGYNEGYWDYETGDYVEKPSTVRIHAYKGSTAEKMAKKAGYKFIAK